MKRGVSESSLECVAQFLHGTVQTVLEIDENLCWPKQFSQLFAGNDLPGTLQQRRQHLEGLSLKRHASAEFAQLSGCRVQLEDTEAKDGDSHRRGLCRRWHDPALSRGV